MCSADQGRVLSRLPELSNELLTAPPRNTTAAITAIAIRLTSSRYSTKLAPSSRVNVDESQCLVWNNIGVPFRPRSAGTSVPVAAQLAAGLVELVVHLATQEDDRRDDGKGDEGHEEDVLDQVGAPLV